MTTELLVCYAVLVVVQCVMYKGTILFCTSKHSGKFLITPKPRNDRVLSWIREKLMQTRSGFCDLSEEFPGDIRSTRGQSNEISCR